jgi:hypothetical protein
MMLHVGDLVLLSRKFQTMLERRLKYTAEYCNDFTSIALQKGSRWRLAPRNPSRE